MNLIRGTRDHAASPLAGCELGGISNNGTQDVTAVQAVALRTADPGDGPFRGGSASAAPHADFDRFYTPVNSFRQGSGGGAYTVQAGDTLRSVAAAVYGDSQLWYLIAEANGLAGEAGLAEGATIILPAGVTRNTNRADTFQPFNPADAIGDTSPAIPQPGRGNQCGILGQILLAVVAVAVSLVTFNPATGLGVLSGTFGAGSALAGAVGATGAARQTAGVEKALKAWVKEGQLRPGH